MLVRRVAAAVTLALTCALAVGMVPSPAGAESGSSAYAPLNRPGPKLRVSAARLAAAMTCHGRPKAGPEPVLLNPATSVTPQQNYSWTYEPAFTAQHRYCAR